MATIASAVPRLSLAPDRLDRTLAISSIMLFAFVLAAIARGYGQWSMVPPFVWGHLVTILVALALTPVMLLRRRGDRLHRRLGWVWSGSLFLTAAITFGIHGINSGRLSLIHILSAWTLIQVPLIVWAAKTHQVARHRAAVRGMIIGALLIAGFFTFMPDRMLGHWLFG